MILVRGLGREGLVSLLCLIAFGVVAVLIDEHRIYSFDIHLIRFLQGMESPAMTRLMEAVSASVRTKPVVVLALALMALLYFVFRHRWELLLVVAAIGGSTLLNSLLKEAFARERPSLHRIVEESGYSFPSGHSMAALSLYGVAVWLLWRHVKAGWGRALMLLVAAIIILAVGASRIYLGVHYPSDVIGGYLLSSSWLALSIGAFRRFAARNATSPAVGS